MNPATEPSVAILQLMGIVNQLHRLAIQQPACAIPAGMTISQVAVIGLLVYSDGREVYQRDLESLLRLRRSTVSSLLNNLERREMVRRVSVPHDARLKKLELAPEGRKLGNAVREYLSYAGGLMIQGLAPEEVAALQAILGKIQRNLDSAEA